MQKWQYTNIAKPNLLGADKLNELGILGWELVTIIIYTISNPIQYNYIFKRPLEC